LTTIFVKTKIFFQGGLFLIPSSCLMFLWSGECTDWQ